MRKARAKKRELVADPKFNDAMVTRFINCLMSRGKKSTAAAVFYDALDIIKEKTKKTDPEVLELWKKAIDNVAPTVEVKSRRIGGATFQVPIEVRPDRRIAIGMKNIIKYAKDRGGKPMRENLAAEIMAAFNEEGGAFKKKEDTHKMADANKAFAHFRF